jgi:ubiquinone/menaquinone biosynthesis C-methylase UbiE
LPADTPTCEPYSALAAVYDGVMQAVPYADWFAFIQQHLQIPGLLIDLFGGTGAIAKVAAQRGITAISLDQSQAMLRRAPGLRVQASAVALPLATGIASACTAANCSINHLGSVDLLHNFLFECRRVLKPNGLLVIDFCPVERAWALNRRTFEAPGAAVFYHEYAAERYLLTSRVTVLSESSAPSTEIHRQRIFTQTELADSVAAAGFAHATFTPNYGLPVPVGVAPIVTLVALASRE